MSGKTEMNCEFVRGFVVPSHMLTPHFRYLIMEYVKGGELFHYVDERKGLPEDETVYIFRQIVSALLYCHRLLICHRDLKPENILLDREKLTVKLIDFGMAALPAPGSTAKHALREPTLRCSRSGQ